VTAFCSENANLSFRATALRSYNANLLFRVTAFRLDNANLSFRVTEIHPDNCHSCRSRTSLSKWLCSWSEAHATDDRPWGVARQHSQTNRSSFVPSARQSFG